MQEIWKQGYAWDEELPNSIQHSWTEIQKDIESVISKTTIPRHYFTDNEDTSDNSQLHIFVDASQKAYGACAYICKGKQSSLVMAKNRVAPLKGITLPRLELMAAVIGARLGKHLRENLEIEETVFWSDSQIVLCWLASDKPLNKFIANRKREINRLTQLCSWRYVPTDCNPADLQTRGISRDQFKNSKLWIHGPEWLTEKSNWPSWEISQISSMNTLTDGSESANETSLHIAEEETGLHKLIDIARHSSIGKLLRITCYMLRFIRNCKSQRPYNLRRKLTGISTVQPLTSVEMESAKKLWISCIQRQEFSNEMENLASSDRNRLPLVKQLRLFIGDGDVIRCGGRINNSSLEDTAKYPILLPKRHLFTDLIVRDSHRRLLHSGAGQTITLIRQTYWIPAIRQCVNSVLRSCIQCRKVIGKPYTSPDPPPLPKDRITEATPFSTTGVDFAGPLYVRNDNCVKKVYICLFTCAWTRAIHLELVPNLSTESFILAFRRFVSIKNSPQTMYSDNAATFVSAHAEIVKTLSHHITWKFIPKGAPWYGGWWERLIGMTKVILKKVLGKAQINQETLRTILSEIETVINDRPLTYVSSEIRDLQPLTPSHLLYGRRKITPSVSVSEEYVDINHSEANKKLERNEQILQHFLKRWRMEYLTGLREFHKVSGNNETKIKVGDVVQVYEDAPRTNWKLAVIDELIKGNDGLVRAAKLHTASNRITTRPVTKLYPLELS